MRLALRNASTVIGNKASIFLFLCPVLVRASVSHVQTCNISRSSLRAQARQVQSQSSRQQPEDHYGPPAVLYRLPTTCPGCGAFAQTVQTGEAGFYSISRKPVKAFVYQARERMLGKRDDEAHIFENALKDSGETLSKSWGFDHGLTTDNGKY